VQRLCTLQLSQLSCPSGVCPVILLQALTANLWIVDAVLLPEGVKSLLQ
jgi:hypothetical protein